MLRPFRDISRAGLTLVELMVVIALIAIMMSIAMPNLWPVLAFSEHEGAARRLAQYGRAASSHAVLARETITIHFDFDEGEYWCTHIPEEAEEEDDESPSEKANALDKDLPDDPIELMELARSELGDDTASKHSKRRSNILEAQSAELNSRMTDRSTRRAKARVAAIDHDSDLRDKSLAEQFYEDRGPLHDTEDDPEDDEPVELEDNLLPRSRLPEGIVFKEIRIGEETHNKKEVTLEISPMGLLADATFTLENADGDIMLVEWDPVTGRTRISDGDE